MGMGLTIGSCIQLINWSVFKRRDAERKSCRGCKYRKQIGSDPKDTACMYLLMTGYRRGCPAESCDRYEKKKTAAPSPQKRNGQRKKNITIKSISQPAGKSQQNTWRETHREEAQAASERERAKAGRANPAGSPADFIQTGSPQSREALKGKLRAYQKAYYAANKERIAERQRAYRAAHKEKARAYQKEYRERRKREAKVNEMPG